MKSPIAKARNAFAAMAYAFRGGRVVVVSMLCRDCGRWVKPGDWNPNYALCAVCAMHAAKDGRLTRAGNRWEQTDQVKGGVVACHG